MTKENAQLPAFLRTNRFGYQRPNLPVIRLSRVVFNSTRPNESWLWYSFTYRRLCVIPGRQQPHWCAPNTAPPFRNFLVAWLYMLVIVSLSVSYNIWRLFWIPVGFSSIEVLLFVLSFGSRALTFRRSFPFVEKSFPEWLSTAFLAFFSCDPLDLIGVR